MSRRLFRLSFVLGLLLAGEAGAIGLGDIRLDSALNEPLRAEIDLLSATPAELAGLKISLAPREVFDRYGIDRPVYLQNMQFAVVTAPDGSASVRLSTPGAITEPFLTFLVEASWSSGRLLREYTVLLDPPSYVPPAVQQAPAISAPERSRPSDSGRIEREPPPVRDAPPPRPAPEPVSAPPQPQPEPEPEPEPVSAPPQPEPAAEVRQYDTTARGDYVVRRGDSLWGITDRMRPDARLTMNQTMLAIYEANPGAFGGNINLLKAGATLRIPSADEIFRISRGDALSEVQRQNTDWRSGTVTDYVPPRTETRPSLTLVPPDDEPVEEDYTDDIEPAEPLTREQQIENRIAELEGADVPEQRSLIEIRDNELANLRRELANIRGEVYEPPAAAVEDDPFVEAPVDDAGAPDATVGETVDEDVAADSPVADAAAVDEPADATTTVVRTPRVSEPTVVERIMGVVSKFWAAILGGLVIIAGLLFWRMRRSGDRVGDAGPWQPLDADDGRAGLPADDELAATKTIPAPAREDDSIMVIEEDSGIRPVEEATAEMPIIESDDAESIEETGDTFGSLEDTFSSDTAVNLDQTDPIAEADFHMAYGLYDQAADLVNGALETDPEDRDLIAKLCEIYFVWGNRDSFIDAAGRLKERLGDDDSGEWDKIVIMGQQIAADDPLFADAGLTAATQAIDLSFDPGSDDSAELDMDFGTDSGGESDIIDLGADSGTEDSGVIDFGFDEADNDDDVDLSAEPTSELPAIESTNEMETVEMPATDIDKTAESPTLDTPLDVDEGGTTELPSLDTSLDDADQDARAAETAEINLDELDLGLDKLAETEIASLDDADELEDTSRNTAVDLEAMITPDTTGEMKLAKDETGSTPALHAEDEETDIDIDSDLLDKTGMTQVLDEDSDDGLKDLLADDDETVQSPRAEGDFDFAQTEALPEDAYEAINDLEETGEMPAIAETDFDLDLEDLTAALKVAEVGDADEFIAKDDTAEQPRPDPSDIGATAEMPTMQLAPDDMDNDLQDARTMTEVGTKLDLARAYVDMGDPSGARSILEEVLEEGDDSQRQQAQQLLDTLPG
ncbi:MAG: hypothetical protein KJO46_06870 [Gammaproteobacteria bacterium]|nr:hypothetical protein [Gammaproteobacteria bacterium]